MGASLKPIHIFRPGKHRDSNGKEHEFSEDRIQAAIAAYDPSLHEAPLCIGHPRSNKPAYGWVKSLDYSDGELVAVPHQVDPQFAELVSEHKYKKRSASFYPAGHPDNPVGDKADYLRHVAFLGAQPPSVKGLRDADFNDHIDGIIVVEFADVDESIQLSTVADVFRRIREWIIGRDGQDAADQVVPAYHIESLQRASERELHEPPASTTSEPGFSEEDSTVSDPNKPAGAGAGKETPPDFAEREAELKRREDEIAERERKARRAELTEFVEGLVTKGRVLPRDRDNLVEFLEAQDAETELEFAEHGDDGKKTKTVKKTGRAWFQEFLENLPESIDYGEAAGTDREVVEATAEFQAPPGYTVDQHRARVHARAKQIAQDKNIEFAEAAVQADRELKQKEA